MDKLWIGFDFGAFVAFFFLTINQNAHQAKATYDSSGASGSGYQQDSDSDKLSVSTSFRQEANSVRDNGWRSIVKQGPVNRYASATNYANTTKAASPKKAAGGQNKAGKR
uniref:Signal peptide protein n=1 Tax=Globodera pallida TaxID=36090 RepID=A0A183CHG6_GLOPA